jgi:hypothetical protein
MTGKRLKAFHLRPRKRDYSLSLSSETILEVLEERHQIRKREVKLSPFARNMILYIENS